MVDSHTDDAWLVPARPATTEVATLYCLPYAGGGATVYRAWVREMPADVAVRAIQLPGRENRLDDDAVIDPASLAAVLALRIDRPYALYGHSMGARLAFEVVRELRRQGAPLPVRLYVGAARPPEQPLPADLAGLSALAEDRIAARLAGLGALPAAAATDPDLRGLLLPALRTDFGWLDGYEYREESPLPMPIVAFAGTADMLAAPTDAAGWSAHTTAGARVRELPGGHFFLHDQRSQLLELIHDDLLSAVAAAHILALPGTGWSVWRDAVLRSTGFPADGLDSFAAPDCAEAADRLLRKGGDEMATADLLEEFAAVFARRGTDNLDEARRVAADPLVREAVLWQNPDALLALDSLQRPAVDEPGANRRGAAKRQRERARMVARYWQRYCAKNETIGFFGPSAWVRLTDGDDAARVSHGHGLVRRRQVEVEQWAVQALADRIAADPAMRRWFPVALAPQWSLEDRTLYRPAQPPVPVTAPEAALLSQVDGRRTAYQVIARAGDGTLRDPEDGFLLLDRLAERGIVHWPAKLPIGPEAPSILVGWLDAVGDNELRAGVLDAWRRLNQAREAVAAASGDTVALQAALARLDEVFSQLTGQSPRRRAGEAYGGRTVCYLEAERDVDVEFGQPVLEALAAPMDIVLQGARWLSAAVADAYRDALTALYTELAADGPRVSLADLWYLSQGLLFGARERPVDAVSTRFVGAWAELFGLAEAPPGSRRLDLRAADLRSGAERLFPAGEPGWSAGRLHSVDLHVCGRDEKAVCAGDLFVVLGELHAAWATFDCAVFTRWHPDPDRLRDALAADLGQGRLRPLYPADWPRNTGRVAQTLAAPSDVQLGVAAAPGADASRLLRAATVRVAPHDAYGGQLAVIAPDGRHWPLIEAFGALVALHVVEGFKLVAAQRHTPRVTVDRLVVVRETWCTTVGASGLATATGETGRYLAARRLRRDLDLPEKIFVKVGTETKPVYADLTSPLYASMLCSLARAARQRGGDEVALTISEMLPKTDHAWLTGPGGNRYFTELRIQVRDHLTPAPTGADRGGST